jgi:endoglucanase
MTPTAPRARPRLTRLLRIGIGLAAVGSVALPPSVPAAVARAADSAFIRVNQVGYPGSSSKRAYLMSTTSEAGATFAVRSGGSTVFSASVGQDLGKSSKTFTHVYPLDFSSVSAAGTYSIVVTGPVAATSPPFRIETGASLYSSAIANAVSFYQNERDGADYIASALRTAPAHLNDANAMTYLTPKANSSGAFSGDLTPLGVRIDASGGWWDAGDYLKFVQTTS